MPTNEQAMPERPREPHKQGCDCGQTPLCRGYGTAAEPTIISDCRRYASDSSIGENARQANQQYVDAYDELRQQLAARDQEIAQQDLAIRALTKQVKETGEHYGQEIERLTRERDALKYEPNGQLRANLSNDAIRSLLDQIKAYRELLIRAEPFVAEFTDYPNSLSTQKLHADIQAALAPRDPEKARE